MKRTTKKSIIRNVLGLIAAIALFAALGETTSAAMQLPWTIGCMAVVVIISKVMSKFNLFEEEK